MTATVLRNLLMCLLLMVAAPLQAGESVKIGILATVSPAADSIRWAPLAQQLSKDIPEYTFTVEAYDYHGLESAVAARQVDFVLTNPSHYLLIQHRSGLSAPLATLATLRQDQTLTADGGVIFTLKDRQDIATLQDIQGKSVACAANHSLYGYQMQAYELSRIGIYSNDIRRLIYDESQSTAVLDAVLAGHADAGFVKAGLLERLAREGKLDLNRIKVLNQQNLPDFPARLSTRLYPNWPFSALPQTNRELMRKVSAHLLSLQEEMEVAQALNIQGFNVPSEYLSVEQMLQELVLPPFNILPKFTVSDIWERYSQQLTLAMGAIVMFLFLSVWLLLINRRLNFEKLTVLQQAQQLRESNTLLDTIINNIPVTIFLKRASDLRYRLINRTGLALLGLEQDAFPEQGNQALIPRQLAEHFSRNDREALERQGLIEIPEEPVETPHGTRILYTKKVALHDEQGNAQYLLGISEDITERKASESEIERLAFYDPLTQLPNRRLLMDRLNLVLHSCARNRKECALLFIDIDHFKNLNDTLGHDIGDLLLQQVAHRLQSCVREGDTVARFGGDEFVVILENLSDQSLEAAAQTRPIGSKILHTLNQPFQLASHSHHSTPSIGITLFNTPDQSVEELLKQADIALYQAKRDGRNCMRFFDPQMQLSINKRVELEDELRNAIKHQQLLLHYQIQVDSMFHPCGAEALIRWQHPKRGMILPAEFIPLADESGLILPIGLWVLETACAQIKSWQQNELTRNLVLAINVSAKQFRQANFADQVIEIVTRHAINPSLLKLELTESMLLENIEVTIATMNKLNEVGIQFSLDDFGTGYSSLQYLKQLPLDQIKIDRSFVRDIASDNNDRAIVRTIIAMAHSMSLDIIAEGVEQIEQRLALLNKGCRHFQGFLFCKPLPIKEFEELVREFSSNIRGK